VWAGVYTPVEVTHPTRSVALLYAKNVGSIQRDELGIGLLGIRHNRTAEVGGSSLPRFTFQQARSDADDDEARDSVVIVVLRQHKCYGGFLDPIASHSGHRIAPDRVCERERTPWHECRHHREVNDLRSVLRLCNQELCLFRSPNRSCRRTAPSTGTGVDPTY